MLEIVDSDQPGGILVVGCNHCIGGRVPCEVKSDQVEPHSYYPSIMHMGDCMVCGHVRESSVHT